MAKFKQQWTPELQDFATQQEQLQGLPAGSLHQLIKQESAGYTDAVSSAGAQGLTQLMPGTAKQMGVTDINDPKQQIAGGAKYYAQLLNGPAEGNPIIAAGMYNSGPNRRAYKIKDTTLLPTETQNYMSKFYNEYASKQQAPQPSIGEKILNAVVTPAYADETPYTQKLQTQKAQVGVSDELSPEQFAALQPVSNGELTPEQFAALQPATTPTTNSDELTPEQFAALGTTKPKYSLTDANTYTTAVQNIIPSAIKLGSGTLQAGINAATHPLDTISGLSNIATGEIQKVIPGKSPAELLGLTGPVPADATKAFDEALYNRYGTTENIANTIATDPVGLMSDITSFGALSKVGLLPARTAVNLVPHPISGATDIALKGAGKVTTGLLNKVNRSNLTGEQIQNAYTAGKGGNPELTYSNTVKSNPLIPNWNDMSIQEKLGMMGSAGLLTPASALLYSPKLVSGAAYGAGAVRQAPAAINKAIDITPAKGLLNQYETEQQNNPIREHINQLIRNNF